VSGLLPYLDKGFVVTTTDANGSPQVPDARYTGTPKWQNYLWRRIGYDGNIYLYAWNPSRAIDTTWFCWQNINLTGIPNNIITNAMLAGGITQDKIASVNWNAIIASGTLPAANGAVIGTYPNLGPLADNSIDNANIQAAQLTQDKFAAQSIDITDTRTIVGSEQYTVPQSNGSAYVKWTPSINLGRVLQAVTIVSTAPKTSGATSIAINANPAYSSMTPCFNSGVITRVGTANSITLDGAGAADNSMLLIEVTAQISTKTLCYVGLYNAAGSAVSLAGAAIGPVGGTQTTNFQLYNVKFSYITSAGCVPATYYVAMCGTLIGGVGQPCYMNSQDGAAYLFGTSGSPIIKSTIQIIEYI
jgi:hypothetical protein